MNTCTIVVLLSISSLGPAKLRPGAGVRSVRWASARWPAYGSRATSGVGGRGADRPGSAHGVPFVGMRGSLPRAPACAGALFQRLAAPITVASRPAPARLASRVAWFPFAPPLARGVRPDGTGSTSRPHLSTLAAAGSQSPVWREMCRTSRAPQPRASTSRSASPSSYIRITFVFARP